MKIMIRTIGGWFLVLDSPYFGICGYASKFGIDIKFHDCLEIAPIY